MICFNLRVALALFFMTRIGGAEVTTVSWYRLGEAGVGNDSISTGVSLQAFGSVASSASSPNATNTPLAASNVSQSFDGVSGSLSTP